MSKLNKAQRIRIIKKGQEVMLTFKKVQDNLYDFLIKELDLPDDGTISDFFFNGDGTVEKVLARDRELKGLRRK